MTISSALTALNTDIQNARTAITNKGGTVTSNGGSSQLASDISTITELKGQTRNVSLTSSSAYFSPQSGYNGITGITVNANNKPLTIAPKKSSQTFGVSGGYSGNGIVSVSAVTSAIDSNIQSGNIKNGVSILGITGSYTGNVPTGTLSITANGTYNVSNYATAEVDVSGGGGGGGFRLEYLYNHSGGQNLSVSINGIETFPLFEGWDNMFGIKTRIIIPSVTNIIVDSQDMGYWADCTIEFTSGGVTRSLNAGEVVTLTQNSTLRIYEADCLLKGTIITMADGSYKEISTIKLGDKVLSINPETGEQEEDEVTYCDGDTKKYNDNYDLWEFENNIQVRTTHHHRFYNVERQAMVYLDEWNIGEHTIDIKGNQVALLNHTNLTKNVHHFTLATKNWNIYFANNLVCGNRNSSEIHLGTEEQKLIQSNPSENIGVFL